MKIEKYNKITEKIRLFSNSTRRHIYLFGPSPIKHEILGSVQTDIFSSSTFRHHYLSKNNLPHFIFEASKSKICFCCVSGGWYFHMPPVCHLEMHIFVKKKKKSEEID